MKCNEEKKIDRSQEDETKTHSLNRSTIHIVNNFNAFFVQIISISIILKQFLLMVSTSEIE